MADKQPLMIPGDFLDSLLDSGVEPDAFMRMCSAIRGRPVELSAMERAFVSHILGEIERFAAKAGHRKLRACKKCGKQNPLKSQGKSRV